MTHRGRRTSTVRSRVLTLVLTLIAGGLAITGLLTTLVQFGQVNDRVEAAMAQEVDELRQIAQGDSANGVPVYTDMRELLFDVLARKVPADFESMLGMVDGRVAYVPGGERPFELNQPAVVQRVLALAQPDRTVSFEQTVDGRNLRIQATSVRLAGEPRPGIFVVGVDVGSQRQAVIDGMWVFAAAAAVTLLVTGVLGFWVTGRLLRPLAELREATGSIDTEDLTRRVRVSDADTDVAQLAGTFNQMLDRLEAGFAEQRRFLDDAAHELRTPLAIIRGNVELVESDDPTDVAQTRELVLDEIDRMNRLVDDLLTLAKAQRPDFVRPEPVDLGALGEELLDRVHLLADRHWVLAGRATGTVQADRQRLLQAVVQLCSNAVRHTGVDDTITVGVALSPPTDEVRERIGPARCLVLMVRDTGSGIHPELAERVFDRFWSARTSGDEGTGLGLSIVSAIAAAHSGTVTLDTQVDVGSTFRVWIPERV